MPGKKDFVPDLIVHDPVLFILVFRIILIQGTPPQGPGKYTGHIKQAGHASRKYPGRLVRPGKTLQMPIVRSAGPEKANEWREPVLL